MTIREMVCQPDHLAIIWADGHRSEYHATWLRDNDPANRDARTGQRLIDVADLPENVSIESAASTMLGLVRLSWSDSHITEFTPTWLHEHCPRRSYFETAGESLWDAATPRVLERFSFASVSNSLIARLEWLQTLVRFGIAFLSDVPAEPGKVLEVAALIGWVRETNYGRIFDVRAVPDPDNLAYTSRALGLHTDNPYREPMPELQILHCLRVGAEGGASLFADGFAVAEQLRTDDSCLFEVLATTPVHFEFADATTQLGAARPIIRRGGSERVEAIAYNSRSIAPLRLSLGEVAEFYRAYRAFALLLRDERFVLKTELREGELVVFRNRRVLHGRTAFSTKEPRWLQGCYLDGDGLRSQISVLKRHGHR
jgi:gamma-butyrobetaine hydroxylase